MVIYMEHGHHKQVAVLSRYKEKNSTQHSILEQFNYKVIIYNKYNGENLLPNVGREGHTYLTYIVNNYHDLPYEILFSQYDPIDHFKCKSISDNKKYLNNVKEFLKQFLYDFVSIRPTDFDFIVRDRKINWIKYCKQIFSKFEDKDINNLICCGANLNGVFRVNRRSILRRPITFYQNCLDLLSKDVDPDEGYFFERMWKYIFTSYGCNNSKYLNFNNNYFLFGTDYGIDNQWTHHSSNLASNFSGNVISNRAWKNNAYGHIFLHESGSIMSNYLSTSLFSSNNESYWSIEKDNRLRFFNLYGGVTSIFDLNNISWPLIGHFYNINKKIENFHWLKPKMFM